METAAFFFILVIGTLGHFIFEWSGHREWAAVFFAVNESTWEHIKLSIYPAFLWALIRTVVSGWTTSVIPALALSQLVMIILIPALFYGYTAITKKNWLITDILCFVIAVAVGSLVFNLLYGVCMGAVITGISLAVAIVIGVMYFRFSIHPPHFFIFRDPVSGGYGPVGHDCNEHFHEGVTHEDCGCHPHHLHKD